MLVSRALTLIFKATRDRVVDPNVGDFDNTSSYEQVRLIALSALAIFDLTTLLYRRLQYYQQLMYSRHLKRKSEVRVLKVTVPIMR